MVTIQEADIPGGRTSPFPGGVPTLQKTIYGMFIFMKDVARNMAWSAAYHPVMRMPEHYEAIFSMGKAEFRRRDEDIDTYTQIAVSPEDDMELRRVSITNNSGEEKRIELTSYFEAVMAPHAADALTRPSASFLSRPRSCLHAGYTTCPAAERSR
jgi:cellobiose phosphorylase